MSTRERKKESGIYDEEADFDTDAESTGRVSSTVGSIRRRNQRDSDQNTDDENTSVEPAAGRGRRSKNGKRSSYYNSSVGDNTGRSVAGSSRGARRSRSSSSRSKSNSGSGGLLACLMCKRNKKRDDDSSDDERHEMTSLSGRRDRGDSDPSRSTRRRSVRDESMRDGGRRGDGESSALNI